LQMTVKTKADVAAWCLDYVSKTLEISREKIDPDTKLGRLGLDSALAMDFMIDLEDWAGVQINSEAFFDYPTIAALSEYVAGLCAGAFEPPRR
jgi:acyl carrier protein